MVTYNPWPLGHIPEQLQRPELALLKLMGLKYNDPREIISHFENKVAAFAGADFGIAVDCCTHAIELSLRYMLHRGEIERGEVVQIPKHTYISIPQMLNQLGFVIQYTDFKWQGQYPVHFPNKSLGVFDAAVRWRKGMYPGYMALQCLSFQIKKRIPIGRGGMIVTDDADAAAWLRLARYDGRDMSLPYDHPDHVKMNGYHYYMTPEDAARGIFLMHHITEEGDSGGWENYPDVSVIKNLYR